MFKIDFTNIREEIIGSEHGLNIEQAFSEYGDRIGQIIQNIYTKKEENAENYGWLNCYKDENITNEILEYSEMVKGKFENILIIGTGTIITAIEAFLNALLKPYWNTRTKEERENYPKVHILKDIDSESIHELTSITNIEKTLVITISGDAESPISMALFSIVKDYLEKKIGENYRMHMVTITHENSVLHQISSQENYKCFCSPKNLGFQLFSYPVLLPLALLNISIKDILKGQKFMLTRSSSPDITKNNIAQITLVHHLLKVKKNKNLTIFLPFSSKMASFSKWYGHFIAERLVKDHDKDGNYRPLGQIIYHAYGNSDQKALLQMMSEGTNIKQINIIKIEKNEKNNTIPETFEYTSIGYLSGKTFSEITNAEIEALKLILTDKQRPNMTFTISEITPETTGALVTAILLNVLILGELGNINPFEIPEEEQLNNYIWAQLGRYGYEQSFLDMQNKLNDYAMRLAPLG